MIGVIDSGIGGLSTLYEILKLNPNCDYVYYLDSINNPYGSKSEEELKKIVFNNVIKLRKKGCKIIVLACNTATAICIDELRTTFNDLIFVGAEPAIKTACNATYKNILVLGTPLTVRSKRVNSLVERYKQEKQNVILYACKNLANIVEKRNILEIEKKKKKIKKELNCCYDCIVLGCTHYCLIKEEIKKILGIDAVIDGNKGIANRIKKLNPLEGQGYGEIILTDDKINLEEVKEILGSCKVC